MKAKFLISVLLLVIDMCASVAYAAEWQPVAPINTARSEFAAGTVNGKIYIFGGVSGAGYNLRSTEMLDLANPIAWSNLADNDDNDANVGIEGITGAGLNGGFYVFGGSDGDLTSGFVEKYDPASDSWSSLAPMPTKRSSAVAVAYSSEIYVFGGDFINDAKNIERHYKVVEAYNSNTDTWRKVTTMPVLRLLSTVAVVGDKAYFIGGGSKSTMKASGGVYAFDFINRKWKSSGLTPMPTPRIFSYGHAAPVLNGKVYLIGGATVIKKPPFVNPSTKVEIYDPVSNTWQTGPELPQPSFFGATVATDNAIYVISGKTASDDASLVNNVFKLTDAWKSVLTNEQTCDLNADRKFSNVDLALFTKACKNKTAYWECDLKSDGKFNSKDTAMYKSQWQKVNKLCSTVL